MLVHCQKEATSFGGGLLLALGIAMVRHNIKVIAIDGDGSLLMRMGNLATNTYYRPNNMLHILLDNNSYDSTGGQDTVSANINFVEIASAPGYGKSIFYCNSIKAVYSFFTFFIMVYNLFL